MAEQVLAFWPSVPSWCNPSIFPAKRLQLHTTYLHAFPRLSDGAESGGEAVFQWEARGYDCHGKECQKLGGSFQSRANDHSKWPLSKPCFFWYWIHQFVPFVGGVLNTKDSLQLSISVDGRSRISYPVVRRERFGAIGVSIFLIYSLFNREPVGDT